MRKSVSLLVAATTVVAGCSVGGHGSGQVVSRNYQVGNFQQVELEGSYDVEVRTGGPVSVSARGPARVLEDLRVVVEGNKLTIGRQHHGWFHFGSPLRHSNVEITVTVPTLEGASLAGSGTINVDKIQGSRFDGSVAGSGDLVLTNVDVQSLDLNVAGSGSLKAGQGRAQTASYDIAGSGSVDAGAIQTQQLKVSIAGSGGVRAHASSTANVDIMGSGDVDITGGAKCTVNKAGSGNVRCS